MLIRDEFDSAYDNEVRCDQCGDRMAPAYLEPGTPICKECWAELEVEEAPLAGSAGALMDGQEAATAYAELYGDRAMTEEGDSEQLAELATRFPGRFFSKIPGFSRYLISDRGEVVSLIRKSPKKLSPIMLGDYDGFQLKRDDGVSTNKYRHRLVAEAFNGPPRDGEEARHLDGDKKNCTLGNIAWGTKVENESDKIANGTRPRGSDNGMSRLSEDTAKEIRAKHANGVPRKEILNEYGISAMTHWRIINRKLWSHV